MHLSAISREVGRPKSAISRILQLYSEKETFTIPEKIFRPRIATPLEDRAMKRFVTKDTFFTATVIFRKIKPVLANKFVILHDNFERKSSALHLVLRQTSR